MTIAAVPTSPNDPSGKDHGAASRTVPKNPIVRHGSIKLAMRQGYRPYRLLQYAHRPQSPR